MRAKLLFRIFLLTVAAVVAFPFVFASVNIFGLMNSDFKAAEIIGERCPFHLVPVPWVSGSDQGDVLVGWYFAEIKARMAALLALWILGVGLLVWRHFRSKQHI